MVRMLCTEMDLKSRLMHRRPDIEEAVLWCQDSGMSIEEAVNSISEEFGFKEEIASWYVNSLWEDRDELRKEGMIS